MRLFFFFAMNSNEIDFFLIAVKATVNWKHMVKNCPRIRSKFKSLFYKGEKVFLQLEARRREVSRRTKGKRKHSKEYFQKKILTSRRKESFKREYRSPYNFSEEISNSLIILVNKTTYISRFLIKTTLASLQVSSKSIYLITLRQMRKL